MKFPWWKRGPRFEVPPELVAYEEATRRRPDRKTRCSDLRIVVLDAETSGFQAGIDRMLSLSVLPVLGSRIRVPAMRSWMIYQPDAAVNPATLVHGILPSETAAGRPEAEVLREVAPVLSGAVLVGHHISFDLRMLNAALERNFGMKLRNVAVDTAMMAMSQLEAFHRTGYANQRPPSLEEVCSQLEIDMVERHTAAGDAFTTAQVWLQLLGLQRERTRREVELRDVPQVHY